MREIEIRLGIAERLAACLDDSRAPGQTIHGLDEIIRFRLLMIPAGYEDGRRRTFFITGCAPSWPVSRRYSRRRF